MGLSYSDDRWGVNGDTLGMRLSMRLAATALLLLAVSPAAAEDQAAPYPLEQWAMRDVISNVALSPDGKRLGMLRIRSQDGDPALEIYDTADLDKEPFRVNADPMELIGFSWVNDRQILFGARQLVRDTVRGREVDPYKYKVAMLNVDEKEMHEFDQRDGTIVNLLPDQPNKVIVAITPANEALVSPIAKRAFGRFRPSDYYELDLTKRTKKLLVQGRLGLGQYRFNAEGRLWHASGRDDGKREAYWMWRPTPDAAWQEIHRTGIDDYEFNPFVVIVEDDAKPNHALVSAYNGHDTLGLWSYDMVNKRFGEIIYRRADADVVGVRYHSNSWTHPETVVGVVYATDKIHVEYFDPEQEALYRQLEEIIPHAFNLGVGSSRDGKTFMIVNSGPRDPGTYYLLKDGQLQTIGSRQPLFESERLADVEYVHYSARDGYEIPAYVTIPNGEPPFPLIVMPHGGPSSRDGPTYDKWAQMLANNGYLVVQPQFRGGTGFGLKHFKTQFEGGSQWGRKMQDDKDDAAIYLVKRGLADEDRMAMFGWSYGGYAAGVAASRTPQLYQCVIAGAAVFDVPRAFAPDLQGEVGEARRRYDALVAGSVNPIDNAAKVNVPMLIIHGVIDYRVLVGQSTRYIKALDEHEKNYQYVELARAGHFSNTLRHNHQVDFYGSMLDFLADDCGPGGL